MTARHSYYDPKTRKIYLTSDATTWTKFHELAHKEQHDQMVPAFVVWLIFARIRLIRYFATLFVEWDAQRRQKRVMKRLGLWSEEAQKQSRDNLASYFLRREVS